MEYTSPEIMSWSLYLEYKNSADSDFSIVSFACVHRFSAVFLSPFLFACPPFPFACLLLPFSLLLLHATFPRCPSLCCF